MKINDCKKSLLIIGAGGHGRVVKEIAETIEEGNSLKYGKIDFLDDNFEKSVGTIDDLETLGKNYEEVFCAIGNNEFRKKIIEKIDEYGFVNPILIHKEAYVSSSAEIAEGTVIEPKAVVNANAVIHKGCIISIGTLVDHDVVIEECCHINAGAICKAGSYVEQCIKVDAGQIVERF